MNILIFDNDDRDRALKLAKDLCSSDTSATVCYNGGHINADGSAIAIPPQSFALILCHKKNCAYLKALNLSANCVITFSGGSGAEIPRGLNAKEGLSRNEAAHIISSLAETGAGNVKEHILAYWSEYRVARCAMRLLCEAWLLNQGEASRSQMGLDLVAPTRPDHWFAPFATKSKSPGTPSESATVEIAKYMGAAKVQASSLLGHLAKLWEEQTKEDVSPAALRNQVSGLRDALKAQNRS